LFQSPTAIFNAAGKRIRDLPIRQEDLAKA
jgi:CO/xanthine dehydrogenase Mo-binding subunit